MPRFTDERLLAEQRRMRELGEKLKLPHLRSLGIRVKLEPKPKPKHRGGRPRDPDDEKIVQGIAFLNRHPGMKLEEAYPALRKLLRTEASDSTLWRRIWRWRKR